MHTKSSVYILTKSFSGFLKDINEDISQQSTSQELSSHYSQHSAIEEHDDDSFFDDFEQESDGDGRNLTCHSRRKLKLLSSWRKERESMIKIHRNSYYCISPVTRCFRCSSENPEFRCKDCGPYSFFCLKCLIETHEEQNVFHFPEKWQVNKSHLIWIYYPDLCFPIVKDI